MKILTLLLVLMFPVILSSQKAPIKWNEIPMEDLKMTTYEIEPSAPAVVLCDYGQISFDWRQYKNIFVFYDRHVRIKILKPEGAKYARISIPFHNMLYEKLGIKNAIEIKAKVYNLSDNGKLVGRKVKSKDIQYRDSTNSIRIAEFTFPDVKPGSIIEYDYQKPTLDLIQPESWYFQRDIPTRLSELRMRVPEAFEYLFSTQNISDFDIQEKTYPVRSGIPGMQIRFVKNNVESFDCQKFITKPEDFIEKINIHLDLAKDERIYNYYQLLITTYNDYDTYTPFQRRNMKYPAEYIVYKLPSWEKVNTDLLESERFGLPLSSSWDYQTYLNQMTANKITQQDQMVAIYNYLRKNMKWTGEYNMKLKQVSNTGLSSIYAKAENKLINKKSLADPFQNKEGTSSEINFLLIYFLNKAGIETCPVIISTRNNGKIDKDIPESKQFNHVLACAKIGKEQFLLDATDSLRPYNILDINDLNSTGYVVKRKEFGWIPITNEKITETSILEKTIIDSNFQFSMQTSISETGYEALNHRKEIYKKGKEKFISDYTTQHLNSTSVNQFEIKNINNDALPLILNISQIQNKENEKEIKIQANFDAVFGPNNFTEMNRKYPVDFIYQFQKNYVLEIEVPDNYTIELPTNDEYSTSENNASFKYNVSRNANKIELKINLQILKSEFPESEYNNLKELFTKLNDKLKESVVITRSSGKNI
jgi:hypothetical protein